MKLERPPEPGAVRAPGNGGLGVFGSIETALTLASLPLGARLVIRCRKDWRTACVVCITEDKITLSVAAPSGHTYKLRRLPETMLMSYGSIPVLGEGCWRSGLARYDLRW